MTFSTPRLSIGLPVFNGEDHLEQALHSLLTQTFENFELIISDNGSNDRTEAICSEAGRSDSRIHYIRHDTNRGAAFNWNFVVAQAKGTFFKWASANDYWDPRFLSVCMEVMESRDDVVLCYTRTHRVREDGTVFELDCADFAVLHDSPTDRFIRLMRNYGRNNAQSGIIRLKALMSTKLDRDYPHGDKVLMAELGLRGKYWLVDEPLFYRRWGGRSSSTEAAKPETLRAFLAPEKPIQRRLDLWHRQIDFTICGLRYPLPMTDKLRILGAVVIESIRQRGELFQEFISLLNPRVRR